MGSVLLGAGSKGMRAALEDSETMLHQSSGGAVGNIQDAEITMIIAVGKGTEKGVYGERTRVPSDQVVFIQ
jgi:ATP-dependent protease ClpP protease subunit